MRALVILLIAVAIGLTPLTLIATGWLWLTQPAVNTVYVCRWNGLALPGGISDEKATPDRGRAVRPRFPGPG
jgi:hypothetical protein